MTNLQLFFAFVFPVINMLFITFVTPLFAEFLAKRKAAKAGK